ncbi:hypothetical protein [Maribacter luteus]|uniref:hypothetical protein n=1 Tax=Maribacter luteus TaxID=2594478 RepID=UPI00249308C3|nr:hypothetical protein [Maribacter luteus]
MVPKDYSGFIESLEGGLPAEYWPDALKSLWYDAKGNWEISHDLAQDIHDDLGSWIHAYLHRKEGDNFNAAYWYAKANKPFPTITLKDEFKEIVDRILSV